MQNFPRNEAVNQNNCVNIFLKSSFLIKTAEHWQMNHYSSRSNGAAMKKRFLRDGILDEMIENLKQLEIKNWKRDEKDHAALSSLVNLFEGSRRTLKRVEKAVEIWQAVDSKVTQDFIKIATMIQSDLKCTFDEIHETSSHE